MATWHATNSKLRAISYWSSCVKKLGWVTCINLFEDKWSRRQSTGCLSPRWIRSDLVQCSRRIHVFGPFPALVIRISISNLSKGIYWSQFRKQFAPRFSRILMLLAQTSRTGISLTADCHEIWSFHFVLQDEISSTKTEAEQPHYYL